MQIIVSRDLVDALSGESTIEKGRMLNFNKEPPIFRSMHIISLLHDLFA